MSLFDANALLEKFRRIEALHAGATTPGECDAAYLHDDFDLQVIRPQEVFRSWPGESGLHASRAFKETVPPQLVARLMPPSASRRATSGASGSICRGTRWRHTPN